MDGVADKNADGLCGWGSAGWHQLIANKHSGENAIFRGSTVEVIDF